MDNMSTLIILLLDLPVSEEDEAMAHYISELSYPSLSAVTSELSALQLALRAHHRGNVYYIETCFPCGVLPANIASGSITRNTSSIGWRRIATHEKSPCFHRQDSVHPFYLNTSRTKLRHKSVSASNICILRG